MKIKRRIKLFSSNSPNTEGTNRQMINSATGNNLQKVRNNLNNNSSQKAPSEQQLTSNDLLIEQMKMQRELWRTQRLRQQVQAKENAEKVRRLNKAQAIENKKEEQASRDRIKIKRMEDSRNEVDNTSLYKTRSNPVPPVPMKN